jgi:UPF0755 protein
MGAVLNKPLGRIIAGAAVLLVLFVGWFILQTDPVFSSPGPVVVVVVHPGESLAGIAAELHAKGVIASPLAFRLDSAIFGTPIVQPGEYRIAERSSFSHVRAIFDAPRIVVTPGLTLHEVAVQVAQQVSTTFANTFAADATAAITESPYASKGSLEGLIGPGQYIVTPDMTPAQLLKEMVDAFKKEATSVGLTPSTSVNGLDAYQLVIAASIVEKEGYYASNMPKVARVIYNRLARGGPLQMDATVLYYFNQDGGTVTHSMLQTPTPYNTYLNAGLTPTPICTVSTTALEAMLHAPPGPWLYFVVVDKNGTEAFSATFAEQLANERLAASRGL